MAQMTPARGKRFTGITMKVTPKERLDSLENQARLFRVAVSNTLAAMATMATMGEVAAAAETALGAEPVDMARQAW